MQMRGVGAAVAPPPDEVLRLADADAVLAEERATRARLEEMISERNCLDLEASDVVDGIMFALRSARVFEQRVIARAA